MRKATSCVQFGEMFKPKLIILLGLTGQILACGNAITKKGMALKRESGKDKSYGSNNKKALFVANTEKNSYYFIGYTDNYFEYIIGSKTAPSNKRFMNYYAGKYDTRNDTMFLSFYRGISPMGINYIVRDTSDRFLIQPLVSMPPVYLNIRY